MPRTPSLSRSQSRALWLRPCVLMRSLARARPPPLKAKERRVDGLCAAIQRVLAASLAAVVFAFAAGVVFAAGGTGTSHRTIGTNWSDERAATTGQTGSWSEGVAYDPDTQTADIDGEAVFMPNAASKRTMCDILGVNTLANGRRTPILFTSPAAKRNSSLTAHGELLGDVALRLMLQRIAYPEHPPCELYLDIPGEPAKTSRRNKEGTKT